MNLTQAVRDTEKRRQDDLARMTLDSPTSSEYGGSASASARDVHNSDGSMELTSQDDGCDGSPKGLRIGSEHLLDGDRLSPTSTMINLAPSKAGKATNQHGLTFGPIISKDSELNSGRSALDDSICSSIKNGNMLIEASPSFPDIEINKSTELTFDADQSTGSVSNQGSDDIGLPEAVDSNNGDLEAENRKLREEIEEVKALRAKTIANLKAKKALLMQTQAKLKEVEAQLSDATASKEKLEEENLNMRLGLQKLAGVREDLKCRLQTQKELLKESRADNEEVERKCSKLESERKMESELLGYYRKLAIHTGYYKWGKPIRNLEAELAASLEKK